MKKILKFLPTLLITLLITALLAGCYIGTFIIASREENEQKAEELFSYIRSTLDGRMETISEQMEESRNKNMAAIDLLAEVLSGDLRGKTSLSGDELSDSLGLFTDGSSMNLMLVDGKGNVLQHSGTMEFEGGEAQSFNLINALNLSGEVWEKLKGGTIGGDGLESPVIYDPVEVTAPSVYGTETVYSLYSLPIKGTNWYLMGVQNDSYIEINSSVLLSNNFINNLDDQIQFLDIDPAGMTIENTTPFDDAFRVVYEDANGQQDSYIGNRECEKLGITPSMLSDGGRGEITIQGTSYTYRVMEYTSSTYNIQRYFMALIPKGYTSDISFVLWVALVFLMVMVLFQLYVFLQKEAQNRQARPEHFKPLPGGKLFLRVSMSGKLCSAGAIALTVVLLISFATVTLSQISIGMRAIRERHQGVEEELCSHLQLQEFSDYALQIDYQQQALVARIVLEHDPETLLGTDEENIPFFVTDENGLRVPYRDYTGQAVTCRIECGQLLEKLSKMGFYYGTLYNVDGYPIATTGSYLPDSIGEDSPLAPVLTRKKNAAYTAEEDNNAVVAVGVKLYTLTEEEGETRYLSEEEYNLLLSEGRDGLSSVYGTLLMKEYLTGYSSNTMMESATAILEDDTISGCSYLLYADDEERSLLFKPSFLKGVDDSAIGLPTEALQAEYYGFEYLGGNRYLVHSRKIEVDSWLSGGSTCYWLVAVQEAGTIFRYRGTTVLYAGLITLLCLLVLLLCRILVTARRRDRLLAACEEGAAVASRKMGSIIRAVICLFMAAFLAVYVLCWCRTSEISVMSWIAGGTWLRGINVFSITCVCLLLCGAYVVSFLLMKLTGLLSSLSSSRVQTMSRLFASIQRYAMIIFVVFYGLHLFGMDTSSVLTSFGLFSMLIGLGANKLIGDIVAGIFIILEGEFKVGDIVTIQNFCGKVTDIGVRTTTLENKDGNLSIYTNSSILNVLNMTTKASRVKIDLQCKKDVPSEQVEETLEKVLPLLDLSCPYPHENLHYLGIDQISGANNVYRVEVTCSEYQRNAVFRYLNRELIKAFKENGVPLA